MTKTMRFSGMLVVMLGLAALSCAGQMSGPDQGASPAATRGRGLAGHFDLALNYTYKEAKIASESNSGFGLRGGSADGVFWFRGAPNIGLAFDVSGESSNNTQTNLRLSQVSVVGGPRFNILHGRGGTGWPSVYVQELAGVVHAYDSVFPILGSVPAQVSSSANGFAFQTGGGVNIPLKGNLGWRVGEVDYILTNLPNGTNGYQGDIRVSGGITFHFR